ncbi:Sensor histidine kinase TmoS [compost metagenome]
MHEINFAAGSQETPKGCHLIRQARNLPDLFERAASIFQETSGATYVLIYLLAGDEEAIEISYAGTPPTRSRELPWRGTHDPRSAPWRSLQASKILPVEHLRRPYALVVLGPREGDRSATESLALKRLCKTTAEMLEQTLLETRALAADFQEQRANRHHQQAKSLGQRLRQVSHDLRNHLVPMLYATEELQEILSAPDALKLIINLERQIRLADQLSKESLTALVPAATPGRTELVAVCREIAEHWQRVFAQHQQTLALQLPDHEIWVDGDPSQHHQVLGNLLSNAHKYTPRGGSIRLSIRMHPDHCLLEVSDSGRGIAPLVRKRLFEACVREHASIEGHGVGLTNVQAVLRGLGGSISVTSRPGRGSCFQVRLRTLCGAPRSLIP